MSDPVKLHIEDRIAVITLNRPDRLNAFNHELCAALNDAVAHVSADEGVHIVVLTGEGRAFSSGADLKAGLGGDESLVERLNRDFLPSIQGIHEMPKPVIAAVNGPAAGIAVAYVLACDLAVMDSAAYVMLPFVNIGLVPDGGITWELVRQMGYKRAYEFMISGDQMTAERCLELGLVNRLSEPEQALTETLAWAKELLEHAPLALHYGKQALRTNMELSFRDAFQKEGELQEICGHSEDFREGVAAFLEKRKAHFKGR